MALTSASFTANSVFGQPNYIFFTDTSQGTDSLIKSRVIYIRLYNGTYLTLSGQVDSVIVVAEVKARCFIGSMSLRTTGDLIQIYVTDPVLGVIEIANYTQTSGDTTLDILITNIIQAINNNTATNGYSAANNTSTAFDIIAKTGLGSTINGNTGGVTYPGGGVSSNFSGGVTEDSLPVAGQNYNYWPYADNTLLLNILTQDTAASIRCDWLGATNNVLYTSTILTVFNQNAQIYDDFLISGQQANPSLVNATNYYNYRIALRLAINDAINSISQMSDITNSQQACDRGTYLINNQNLFF